MAVTFNGGTVVLDAKGQWWVVFALRGGTKMTLVQGSLSEVKSWSRSKYGTSIQFPGTSVNIDPNSSAGLGGASTALIFGPWPSKAAAVSGANSGNIPGASGNEQSVVQALTGGDDPTCIFSLPLVGCVLHKSQARALLAGVIIAAAGVVGIVGLMLVVAEGFKGTGAGRGAQQIVNLAQTRIPYAAPVLAAAVP